MPSSVIASMHYFPGAARLRVKFVSGLVYDYKDVPEQVYHAMKSSASKGTYLKQHIKGQYEFEKIDPAPRISRGKHSP